MEAYCFLLLLKPEANEPRINKQGLIQLVYNHLESQGVVVLRRKELSGSSLRTRNALDHLYVRLSRVARLGDLALTLRERSLISAEFPRKRIIAADRASSIFGLSGVELCYEGDKAGTVKVGPGAYATNIVKLDAVVLNHFVPEFRDRFYADGASVIALECTTVRQGLQESREMLVGNIQPKLARSGSLRASLLLNRDHLSLGEVSLARNFFHISPGYIEAAYQLAFFFPERGALFERLMSYGEKAAIPREQSFIDEEMLAQIFEETEQLSMPEAVQALQLKFGLL